MQFSGDPAKSYCWDGELTPPVATRTWAQSMQTKQAIDNAREAIRRAYMSEAIEEMISAEMLVRDAENFAELVDKESRKIHRRDPWEAGVVQLVLKFALALRYLLWVADHRVLGF